MSVHSPNSFDTRTTLSVGRRMYDIYRLERLEKAGYSVGRLPFSLAVLLENLLRHEDGVRVKREEIDALARWDPRGPGRGEIAFLPARVLLQDFTGVPAVVDLAAMRDAIEEMGGDPGRVNPVIPAELVIDHSVQVDSFGSRASFARNADREFERNGERYALLRWAQEAFRNFVVVPPATGIVHQVNLERLARVVCDVGGTAFPDTLVGADSHTTMVNALGVVGWGVGGIEVEAAMLGQPLTMIVPDVLGVRLHGRLPDGTTATDLVLTITEMLRAKNVVGKIVEFFGDGLDGLSLADRATIANMSPEFGSTAAVFPIDAGTIDYLRMTGRTEERIALVEAYAKEQGLFRTAGSPAPRFSEVVELDLGTVEAVLAGPRRPQDRVPLGRMKDAWHEALPALAAPSKGEVAGPVLSPPVRVSLNGETFDLGNGSVVIAAVTSCTNTSNPPLLIAAGLLAKKAAERGLRTKPWVKTSFAPGSKVVTRYLRDAGLIEAFEALRFHLVGYGCTTCIGNSGPLADPIQDAIRANQLVVASVLSGNRNFGGRIHPDTRANYLASPPLVVAYALAGKVDIDLRREPLGKDRSGKEVFLRDIWPKPEEVRSLAERFVRAELFAEEYADLFTGDERWRAIPVPRGGRFAWEEGSTYVRRPPFFDGMGREAEPPGDITGARVLAFLGDSVTTDHISPAGSIPRDMPAGRYLVEKGVAPSDFNSFGARRGNHEVMMRGTFGNVRLRNALAPGTEGGWTTYPPGGETVTIFEAAERYREAGVPLVLLAGREYGAGSSRDWAAKGTVMLGVRAVLAESFERIHRTNLIGMGVLPIQYLDGENGASLSLTGKETFDIRGIRELRPGGRLSVSVRGEGGERTFEALARIDTPMELAYYRHGGILRYVLRELLQV